MRTRRPSPWRTAWVIWPVHDRSGLWAGDARDDHLSPLKAALDAIPAIDTHDHLWPFDRLPGLVETERGKGMNLAGLWRNSYFTGVHPLTAWKPGMAFDAWWGQGQERLRQRSGHQRLPVPASRLHRSLQRRLRSTSPTSRPARSTNEIFAHYQDQTWLFHVVTERANIELMLNDPYWGRLEFKTDYPFGVLVFNVTTLVAGFHSSEFKAEERRSLPFCRGRGDEAPIA